MTKLKTAVAAAAAALMAFAAVVVLKLPRGLQIHVFEPLDFVTFLLVAPAVGLLCAVLAQGVNAWWFNAPWLAYALIASLVLFALAALLEYSRRTPLIQLRWLMHPTAGPSWGVHALGESTRWTG